MVNVASYVPFLLSKLRLFLLLTYLNILDFNLTDEMSLTEIWWTKHVTW